MIGDRWIFARMVDARTAGFPGAQAGVYTASSDNAEIVAEVSGRAMTTRQADAFQRTLANRLGHPIGSYRTSARTNPTLVHHGLVRGAHFHLLEDGGRALADLYTPQAGLAYDVAQVLADALGIRVALQKNTLTRTGSRHTPLAPVGPSRGRRRNPSGDPQVGETWSTPGGGRCKIVARRGNRVTILHLETGNRETVDLLEFLASYRPPRRLNPCGNPRAPFEPGERVSVPYTGRASYFGRKVKKTREKATVQGYDADGTVHVTVKRGRAAESHHFPASSVRRLPKRGAAPRRLRTQGVKRRIELKSLRERHKAALAAAEKARDARECAEARAKLIPIGGGEPPPAEYTRLMARIRKLTAEVDAQESIAAELEQQDPKWRDPWAAAAAPVTNRRGRKNPSRSARARYQRTTRRAAPRGLYGAGSRRTRRALASGRAAKAHHHMMGSLHRGRFRANPGRPRVVYNRLLGGWYVVVGPHQTPLNGRFDSKADAQEWLAGGVGRRANPKGRNWIAEMAEYHRDMGREAFVDKMLDAMPAAGTLRTKLRIAAGKAWDREHIGQGRAMAAERRAALESFDREFGKPNPKGRKIGIGPRVATVRADTLKEGDIVMPPDRELRLWMIRDAAEKGMSSSDLGIMLTDVHEGQPDKRGRWIIFKGYLRDDWYAGRRKYPFTFKARPETPWPLVATPTPNRRPKANPKGRKIRQNAAGDAKPIWGGKYLLTDEGYKDYPNLGRVRTFIATGKRGAQYGAMVYADGRWHWGNLSNNFGSVPFDLAQVNPASYFDAVPNRRKRNPRGGAPLSRARRTFRKWHEFGAHRVTRVKGPSRVIPKTLVKLGEIRQIVYDSDKYAGGPDNPSGEVITYEHTTSRPRPLLVTDPNGRHVHIVGGRMQVTADGLKN